MPARPGSFRGICARGSTSARSRRSPRWLKRCARRSAKKALLKFQAFANAADSRGAEASTDDKVAGLRAGATHELKLLAIEVRKARLANAACAREMEECAALEAETAAKIEATKVNIARLQGELRSERRVRERKEEYESLAKIINGVPPKVASTKAIAGLEADVAGLGERAVKRDPPHERLLLLRAALLGPAVDGAHDARPGCFLPTHSDRCIRIVAPSSIYWYGGSRCPNGLGVLRRALRTRESSAYTQSQLQCRHTVIQYVPNSLHVVSSCSSRAAAPEDDSVALSACTASHNSSAARG